MTVTCCKCFHRTIKFTCPKCGHRVCSSCKPVERAKKLKFPPFKQVPALEKSEFSAYNVPLSPNYIEIAGGKRWSAWVMDVKTARELRDWLTNVLPEGL